MEHRERRHSPHLFSVKQHLQDKETYPVDNRLAQKTATACHLQSDAVPTV